MKSRTSFVDSHKTRNIMIALTICLAVAYFFQITSSSARGYELKKLSDAKASLEHETGRIDLNIAEESSASSLSKRVETLGLTTSGQTQYVSADAHSVAIK